MKFKKIFGLFLIVFICVSFFQVEAHAKKKKKFKGIIIVNQILKLSGTISVNGNPTPEYSGFKEGDTLETGEKSFAVLRIPGLAIYRLGPQTKIKLTKFSNRDNSKFELYRFEDFIPSVQKMFAHDGPLRENLPMAVAGDFDGDGVLDFVLLGHD